MIERDRLIYTWLKERNIPVVILMAGGYGDEVWRVATLKGAGAPPAGRGRAA